MSGSLGDMGNLLKQAQKVQQEMDKVREDLRAETVEAASPDGRVKVEMGGDRDVKRVTIAPELAGDVERVEAGVLAALSAAAERVEALRKERLSRLTGGIDLPGLY